MRPSWRPWRRGHRQVVTRSKVTVAATTPDKPDKPDKTVASADEVDELANETAELRQQTDELRHQLKETEARLGTVEDDYKEQARIIDTLLDWCDEQESVLAQHRDVVAAMGAAARILEKDASFDDRESAVQRADEQPSP